MVTVAQDGAIPRQIAVSATRSTRDHHTRHAREMTVLPGAAITLNDRQAARHAG